MMLPCLKPSGHRGRLLIFLALLVIIPIIIKAMPAAARSGASSDPSPRPGLGVSSGVAVPVSPSAAPMNGSYHTDLQPPEGGDWPAGTRFLTREECLKLALQVHPDLVAATAREEAAIGRLRQAVSVLLPQIGSSSSYSRQGSGAGNATPIGRNYTLTGVSGQQVSDSYSWFLSLTQRLIDFGKTTHNIGAARENARAAIFNLVGARQTVLLAVNQAFYNTLLYERIMKVKEETVAQRRQHLQQAQSFYAVGSKPKNEVTQAEVDLTQAQVELVSARNDYRLALISLLRAMGLGGDTLVVPKGILEAPDWTMTLPEMTQRALEGRPELLKLRATAAAADHSLAAARNAGFPDLSGNASYGWQGAAFPLNYTWSMGLTLSTQLYTGGGLAGKTDEAGANLAAAQADLISKENNVTLEVRKYYYQMQSARERVGLAKESVRQARENFELAQGRYEVGVGSNLEFTDAQLTLSQALTDQAQALADYMKALADLEWSLGIIGVPGGDGENQP